MSSVLEFNKYFYTNIHVGSEISRVELPLEIIPD